MAGEESFPERLLTEEEIRKALELIRSGYRHDITIKGSREFVRAVREALRLVNLAGQGDLVRAYIRSVVEVEGFCQLRTEEASIWMNLEALKNPVLAASLIYQKALQMKRYLEGQPYYGPRCDIELSKARYDFVRTLRERCDDEAIKRLCDEVLSELEASIYDLVP